jgi:hypothetical protein
MQGCFLIGATIRVFRDNFAPTRAPLEYFLALPPDNPECGGGGSFAL